MINKDMQSKGKKLQNYEELAPVGKKTVEIY